MNRIELVSNFMEEQDALEYMKQANNPQNTEPQPEYYKDRFGGTALPYNETTRRLNKKYGRKAAQYVKDLYGFVNPVYVYKVFMNYTTEVGYEGPVHTDSVDPEPWIEWSAVVYFDNEFEGAKLHFPNQGFIYDPVPNEAIFFPSAGSEYMHGISKLKSGKRMSLVICMTSLPWKVDPDMTDGGDTFDYEPSIYDMDAHS